LFSTVDKSIILFFWMKMTFIISFIIISIIAINFLI
jgi:hypothetical protein